MSKKFEKHRTLPVFIKIHLKNTKKHRNKSRCFSSRCFSTCQPWFTIHLKNTKKHRNKHRCFSSRCFSTCQPCSLPIRRAKGTLIPAVESWVAVLEWLEARQKSKPSLISVRRWIRMAGVRWRRGKPHDHRPPSSEDRRLSKKFCPPKRRRRQNRRRE